MASLMTVRLNKGDSSNWGFRLQGGKDFGTPLVIQKVNGGSPAERAGLIAGDSVIKINNTDVFNLRHKDAQDVVVRAGYNFDMTIQRGGSTWKPSVVPTGSYPPVSPSINNISPVTKTSLAARSSENIGAIGTGHNLSAKPFSPQLNGAVNGGPKLVNKQYNSPLKLYSEQSIAETLSAQTEVLSTGALGVNFKKNEKNYDATNSAVFRMLQEAEKEPRGPEIEPDSGVVTSPNSGIAGLRHVHAPETRAAPPTPQLPPGQNICADCERLIVGVFVRIKDKNLHVECFKCATCGTSLKNVGYYNINNKLYCDIHAKLAARNNPPAPNLVPVTVPPGGKVPASAISAALASHSLPSPSALSPKANSYAAPYQSTGSFSAPKPFSSVSAPLSPHNTLPRAAPLSPVAPAPAPSFSPASSAGRSVQNIIWPPAPEEPELPTACPLYFPPPSQIQAALLIKKQQELEAAESECDYYCDRQEDYCYFDEMAQYQQPKMSICSEEVTSITDRKSAVECIETISGSLQTQQLVENIMRNRPQSPPPIDADIQPREPPRKRDPPQIPQPVPVPSCPLNLTEDLCCQRRETCDLKRPTQFTPNTLECQPKSKFVENTVPQQWESSMVQALRIAPDADAFHQIPTKTSTTPLASALAVAPIEPFTPLPPLSLQPVPLPEETEPYFPPEHPTEIEPKEPKPDKPDSEFVSALKIAPDRPFTPAGGPTPGKKRKDSTDKYFQDLPKPQEHLTMRTALTTASDRVYSPLLVESVGIESQMSEQASVKQTSSIDKSMLIKPMKPPVLPASFQQNIRPPQPPGYYPPILKHKEESMSSEEQQQQQTDVVRTRTVEKKEVVPGNPGEVQLVQEVERQTPSNFPPMFQGFTCSFQNKTDHSQFSIEINTTPPILTPEKSQTPVVQVKSTDSVPRTIVTSETVSEEKHAKQLSKKQEKKEVRIVKNLPIERQAEEVVLRKPLPLASALHKPESLPQYQVNLSESVEADLQLMQKMEAAQLRMEQQKAMQKTERVTEAVAVKKPIITVQPGETTRMVPQMAFQPVADDRPPSSTFSPRPRPITPSMINKPPSTLPYYQANLVAQKYSAATVNLLDPTSPAVSRSPSPCPERRSQSPFPSSAAASTRPKSPAPGPPPNPLKSSTPLPTPRDSRVEQAKQSLTSFIPQYKSRRDQIEQVQGMDFYKRGDEQAEAVQMYTSQVQMQNIPQCGMRKFEVQQKQVEDTQCAQMQVAQMGASCVSTAISEKSHMEHLDQLSKSEARSVERSSDGLTQIQRKKTVTEEYEHMQKEQMIQIEKNVSTVKKYPFHDVNAPSVEVQGIQGMHITNPQRLTSKFHQTQCAITAPTQCPQGQTCKLLPMTIEPLQTPRQPPMQHVAPPGSIQPVKHVSAPGSSQKPNQSVKKPIVPSPNAGTGGGRQSGAVGVAPKRGRGVLNVAAVGGARIPLCGQCHNHIRGPFITALGRIWCPDHFICATPSCRRPLADMGFVEERGQLYCEYCFEQYLAPPCSKCGAKIKGDCLKAIGKNFHPECFNCVHCGKLFGNNPFFLEDANPYCEADWNEMFTTKCYACGFPVEAGDRWVEALNNNYHSQCFNCTMCKKNLEGQSFFAKGGRPFCKNHAR